MKGSGVWVVETGCKYDGCGDINRYATYDNEDAARKHRDIVESILARDTNLEVRVYELPVPVARFSEVPPLNEDGWPL
jgi:hypothetical protein